MTTRWSRPDDQWPGTVAKPRTCSYCGGVNPDDLIPLLVAGWHVEPTDKGYKFYVNSPTHLSAVPPVKVYLQHWTQEQVQRADDVLRARYDMQRDDQTRND
ncbi:hypothetical protein [Burkholderia ambifaria]